MHKFLKDLPIHEWAVIPTSDLVFSDSMIEYCKTNTCGNFGKSWTCPPSCGSIEDQKKKILCFKEVLVFTTKHKIEDSFDYDGMNRGRDTHTQITLKAKEKIMAEQIGDIGKPSAILVYGAGACPICQTESGGCSFPQVCRFPLKQIGSIEAAGIDVTQLSKTCGIKYNNGGNTVTFFSMVVF